MELDSVSSLELSSLFIISREDSLFGVLPFCIRFSLFSIQTRDKSGSIRSIH